ncbi:MAG: hypothetical protein WC538_21455 [Thermoanaerobaculia bacterium]
MQVDEGAGTVHLVFRPSGRARFIAIAFLAFWLCGWRAGEWFALRLIVCSLHDKEGNQLARLLGHPAGWLVAGLVLLWFVFWTIGGLGAGYELLRMLAGRDALTVAQDEYVVWRGVGPLGVERRFWRDEVRDLYVSRGSHSLIIEAGGGRHVVTSAVRPEERAALEARFVLPPSATLPVRCKELPETAGVVCIEQRAVDLDGESMNLRAVDAPAKTPRAGWMLLRRRDGNLRSAFHDHLNGRPTGFTHEAGRSQRLLVVALRRR